MALVTIHGEHPWEYIDLLNECIKILLTVAVGILCGYRQVIDTSSFVPQAVRFVFQVALPCHIAKGIGIGVDFYDDAFLWDYIFAFLGLRAIALVVAFAIVFFQPRRDKESWNGIGQVAILWLNMTWLSTIILGIPIAQAVFNDVRKGAFYGLLAGISSFILQLPLQLLFLECHKLEQEMFFVRTDEGVSKHADLEMPVEVQGDKKVVSDDEKSEVDVPVSDGNIHDTTPIKNPDTPKPTNHPAELYDRPPLVMWIRFACRRDVWSRVLGKVVQNPVIWGIVIGFVLSLSTAGPKYLLPTSPVRVPSLDWIGGTLGWFGDIVSPLSLFTMGVWMSDQGKRLFRVPISVATISMVNKLILVPLVMVGLAKAFSLNDEAGRAAVLMACLPISMASFSLASNYKIGEALLSENVALGTALMLPTVIAWNVVMDHLKLFPL